MPDPNISRVRLRNSEVNTQRIGLLNMEHFHGRIIRDDQVADIQVARRDCAGERRSYSFECDLLLEDTKVSGKGIGIGLGRILVSGCVLRVEIGNDAFVP